MWPESTYHCYTGFAGSVGCAGPTLSERASIVSVGRARTLDDLQTKFRVTFFADKDTSRSEKGEGSDVIDWIVEFGERLRSCRLLFPRRKVLPMCKLGRFPLFRPSPSYLS